MLSEQSLRRKHMVHIVSARLGRTFWETTKSIMNMQSIEGITRVASTECPTGCVLALLAKF
jgi:hypothetical protein